MLSRDRRIRASLRHLHMFSWVISHGTMRKAAEDFGVTQPAISQAVDRLEKLFGCELLDRSYAGVAATREGMVVHERSVRLREYLLGMKRRGEIARRQTYSVPVELMISMSQLVAAVTVGDASGFADAARRLGLSEPSVHRAARQLENLLEVRLFRATSVGVEMTLLGTEILRLASLALHEVEACMAELAEIRGIHTGRISLGALPMAQADIIPQAIALLGQTRPLANIEIVEGNYDAHIHNLRRGRLDLMVGTLRGLPDYPDLAEQWLVDDAIAITARKGHPLENCPELSLEDIAAFPWVVTQRGTPLRQHFEALFSNGNPVHGLVETASAIVVRVLLANSDRLSILPQRQVETDEKNGILTTLPYALAHPVLSVGLTLRADWRPTQLQQIFVSSLAAAASRS